ncbi:MAG: hypothetical protein Q4B54_05685 [Coriobacteriales bacterium]|nr:hypothetical protein [Coriobacteriales bacterium]
MNENMTNGAMAISDYDLDTIMGGMMGMQNSNDFILDNNDDMNNELKGAYGTVARYMRNMF